MIHAPALLPTCHRPILGIAVSGVLGLLAAWILVPWAAPAALAAEADRESAMRWFDGVDTDKSGTIDLAEVDRVREKRVRRYDGNGDGYISLDEFNYSVPREMEDELERRRRRFAVMDVDGDERLDRSEYMGFGGRVIEAADIDGDGAVTRDEFLEAVAPD